MGARRDPLAGRRVIVTGAASGLGAAICLRLRGRGAGVVGIDVQPADGIVLADIAEPYQVRGAVAQAIAVLGGLDILVNNAGVGWAHNAGEEPDEHVRRMLEVNLFGAWTTTAAALPALLASRGHVVNVASGIAVLTLPYGAAYSASKRALTAYSDVLRLEFQGRLAVTVFYPGYLETPIHRRNVEQGYTVAGAIPADSLDGAAEALLRSCRRRPRNAYSSARTAAALRLGRIWPGPIERGMRAHLLRELATRPLPDFLAGGDLADPDRR
jgi:NAD(P)-dependent dehydrogenase (short-subunit alcohol dehydrogenase family)